MTTITREFTKEQLIDQAKGYLMLAQCAVDARPDDVAAAKNLALYEIALASLTAEPVAWTDEQELRDVENDGCGYLFKANPISPNADPRRVIKLYRHAQPVPVVPDAVNGLMPCPFCGGKAHQLTIEQDDDPHFGGDVITCTECGASSHVEFGFKENLKSAWNSRTTMLQAGNDSTNGKPLTITLPDTSSKAFWSGTGQKEVFYPETYKRWAKEAIERACMIAGIAVEVK